MATIAPGIFTYTADGKGAGAITHVDGWAVTTQSPAQPGELVILYATGLGPVMPAVARGALPAATSSNVSQVMLNIGGIGVIPDFAGLAGCCVGLNQINARSGWRQPRQCRAGGVEHQRQIVQNSDHGGAIDLSLDRKVARS